MVTNILIVAITLAVIAVTVYVILKKYKPQAILFLAGIVLMLASFPLGVTKISGLKKPTGFLGFDIFSSIHTTFSEQLADIGLIILVLAAFSAYMEKIGASQALVKILIRPLKSMRSPYLVLALGYVVGQILHAVVPSAAGLAMLLMTTLYPTLIRLGVHPLSAAAIIGSTGAMDLGPASGMTNLAAKTLKMDTAVYFAQYQLQMILIVITAIAITQFICQYLWDKKDGQLAASFKGAHMDKDQQVEDGAQHPSCPIWWSILPVLPIILIIVFSPLVYGKVRLGTIPAVFVTIAVAMVCVLLNSRSVRRIYENLNFYLKELGTGPGMDVVTLMVSASVFATGLKTIGVIELLTSAAKNSGTGEIGIVIVMTAIIVLVGALTGSGNAAFFSFCTLAPDIAIGMGFAPVLLVLPMQLAAGMGRAMSPVAGVIIICAGIAKESPLTVTKRTAIPMLVGVVTLLTATIIIHF
jgi:DcuC family C4-dicarboxylate transporter